MDTDSLILSLEEDFYETIKENPERFNTSKYKLSIPTNTSFQTDFKQLVSK